MKTSWDYSKHKTYFNNMDGERRIEFVMRGYQKRLNISFFRIFTDKVS